MQLMPEIASVSMSPSRKLHLTDIDWFGEPSRVIEGFTLTTYNTTGIDAGDVTFTDDSVTFEWSNEAIWFRSIGVSLY